MNYWIDLFTGDTWRQFRAAGARVSGFRALRRKTVAKIKPGDVLLCYLTGVMHWIGALEVIGPTNDQSEIWKEDEFPARLAVQPIVMLDPEFGIPMSRLKGKVDFFATSDDAGKFKGFVRGSPNQFRHVEDGELILKLLRDAERNPVAIPVDPRKLAKKLFFRAEGKIGKKAIATLVSVPEPEEAESGTTPPEPAKLESPLATTRHTEIQYHLLQLGAGMGLDVWVARNDRSRNWRNTALGNMPKMVEVLPTQFNEATQRTIELIDVLWLKGNSIVAAFEVECTTSVYSGLLRMSDLLALQPNLDIKLYLVAPDERRDKVEQEICRPTFGLREKPLAKICGFLSFSRLVEKVDGIRKLGLASHLNPAFLEEVAEYFLGKEGED